MTQVCFVVPPMYDVSTHTEHCTPKGKGSLWQDRTKQPAAKYNQYSAADSSHQHLSASMVAPGSIQNYSKY